MKNIIYNICEGEEVIYIVIYFGYLQAHIIVWEKL